MVNSQFGMADATSVWGSVRVMSVILTTTSNFDVENNPVLQDLEARGFSVVVNPYKRRLTEDEATTLLTTHQPIGMIAGVEPLTRAVLESAKGLRVISRCGTGMESVDRDAARDLGMAVRNTPEAPALAVAELTIGLILAASRRICRTDRALRDNHWEALTGSLLYGKTIGLIGYGHIGRRVAELARGFGTTAIVHDPHVDEVDAEVRMVPFETLLQEADIVSLHLPYSAGSHHLINRERLAMMKQGAILINAARGGLVDEVALAEALENGSLAGAGLDVYEEEPYGDGPLTEASNLVMTAHMGSYAREARRMMELEAAENLRDALEDSGLSAMAGD